MKLVVVAGEFGFRADRGSFVISRLTISCGQQENEQENESFG